MAIGACGIVCVYSGRWVPSARRFSTTITVPTPLCFSAVIMLSEADIHIKDASHRCAASLWHKYFLLIIVDQAEIRRILHLVPTPWEWFPFSVIVVPKVRADGTRLSESTVCGLNKKIYARDVFDGILYSLLWGIQSNYVNYMIILVCWIHLSGRYGASVPVVQSRFDFAWLLITWLK